MRYHGYTQVISLSSPAALAVPVQGTAHVVAIMAGTVASKMMFLAAYPLSHDPSAEQIKIDIAAAQDDANQIELFSGRPQDAATVLEQARAITGAHHQDEPPE